MQKVVTKKEMTLPELIEWGFKNKIKNREFECKEADFKSVVFNSDGWIDFSDEFYYLPEDTFMVAIEEEISEDTVIPVLLQVYTNSTKSNTYSEIYENKSIKDVLGDEIIDLVKTFHLVKEDGEHVLIWKNGKVIGE